jgi:uracil-DNA glycosylase family 4
MRRGQTRPDRGGISTSAQSPEPEAESQSVSDLDRATQAIVTCNRCERLRSYCQRIGREKRAAYRQETYWARPVPGFGDPRARIVLVGLAPAAHGANRTGRVFTGDGHGGSGDFLMTALHANGLANQPFSRGPGDGLVLIDTWIAATVRCAPPDNKPTPAEIANCHPHLRAEIDALPRASVLVALGRIAFDACLRLLRERGIRTSPRPVFEHGKVVRYPTAPVIVASYHPSRQNTNTGRLTPAMLRQVFRKARALAEGHPEFGLRES